MEEVKGRRKGRREEQRRTKRMCKHHTHTRDVESAAISLILHYSMAPSVHVCAHVCERNKKIRLPLSHTGSYKMVALDSSGESTRPGVHRSTLLISLLLLASIRSII